MVQGGARLPLSRMTASLPGLLARALPPGAIGHEAGADDWHAELHPVEARLVADAAARRVQEVAATRACARRALADLGAPVAYLDRDEQRVPRWPAGVVGSLTHSRDYAASAVAWSRDLAGLGIDAETIERVARANIESAIATPREARWVAGCEPALRGHALALLFSAKEAAYKCVFPRTREVVGFAAAAFELAGDLAADCGEFRVQFSATTQASRWGTIAGRFSTDQSRMVTAAWLQAHE